MDKVAKSTVNYGPGMTSTRCGLCDYFEAPHSCVRVAGYIDTYDWRKLFRRKRT